MKQVDVLIAGGTIDAEEYDFVTGNVISFAHPAAVSIWGKVNPTNRVRMTVLMQKDSDEMTDEDRLLLVKACEGIQGKRIVITHGTGTMVDTGLLLSKRLADKTIVLTGSLPYKHDPTYASFNLGSAITACQLLPSGVYIATSGEIVALSRQEAVKVKDGNVTYFRSK